MTAQGTIDVGGDVTLESFGGNLRFGAGQHTWRFSGTSTLVSQATSIFMGRVEVAEGARLILSPAASLDLQIETALVVDGVLVVPVGVALELTGTTTVVCGANGAIQLDRTCTVDGQPCDSICP